MRSSNDGGVTGDTYTELVTTTVEYRIFSDLVRGEGRVNIQLTVLDEYIPFGCSRHFKFVVTDREE